MRRLLDVNVLIALVDAAHLNHDAAHRWFGEGIDWATCPLTENAFVRILSHSAYPTVHATPAVVGRLLRRMLEHPRHSRVPADAALMDPGAVDLDRVLGSGSVTDVYLAALAHRHDMRLATFDQRLRADAVVGARPDLIEHLQA